MFIGMMNNPTQPVVDEAKFAGEHHFDFLDLTLEPTVAQPQDIPVSQLKKVIAEYGLFIVGHTNPFLPWASPITRLRKAALEELKESIQVFSELGVKKVNIHPHWYQPNSAVGDVVQRNIESLSELLEETRRHSMGLMLEHQPNGSLCQPDAFLPIFEALPQLKFHLDVGHAHVAGQGENQTGKFLENFKKRLLHVHFSDNKGLFDDHLPLGSGKISWQDVIRLLKKYHYDDTITLEVFVKDRDLLLYSKEKLQALWNDVSEK